MTRPGSIALLLCAAMLSSCDKNAVQVLPSVPTAANIKFFNLGINAPGVNFYAESTKMTAISSTSGTESTNGTTYGNVGNGGLYSSIPAGQHLLTGNIAAATDKDLPISSLTATLADQKYYSLYLSGFYNTTAKTIDSFLVEDPLGSQIDFSTAYVRFVNASPNASAMTLYATNTVGGAVVTIGSPVAYKSAGAFVAVPVGVYDVGARVAGGTTNAISLAGTSFVAGHMYTVAARGDMTVTSTSAANRPQLTSTLNR